MSIRENNFGVEVHIRTLGIVLDTVEGGGGKKAKTGPIETNNVRKSRDISPFWDLGNSVEQIKNLIQDKSSQVEVKNAKNRINYSEISTSLSTICLK